MGCCCDRHKHREGKEYRDLVNRLSRIEGQIRGIKKMVEEDRYCVDILTQMSAVQSACNAFSRNLLENHIKTCVVEDIKSDREGTVEELCNTIRKVMK
ncbi:MAG: metal-sensing transcriptional repressor [Lachnospiraceae bacterium]|nr:metal-sensing transcriptional repressor [Lachnospiraceae bacterium]